MKIKEEYKVRKIAGEDLVVKQGASHAEMTRVISLNESAALMWEELCRCDFTLEDAAAVLEAHYEVSHEQALQGAQDWIDSLTGCGILIA